MKQCIILGTTCVGVTYSTRHHPGTDDLEKYYYQVRGSSSSSSSTGTHLNNNSPNEVSWLKSCSENEPPLSLGCKQDGVLYLDSPTECPNGSGCDVHDTFFDAYKMCEDVGPSSCGGIYTNDNNDGKYYLHDGKRNISTDWIGGIVNWNKSCYNSKGSYGGEMCNTSIDCVNAVPCNNNEEKINTSSNSDGGDGGGNRVCSLGRDGHVCKNHSHCAIGYSCSSSTVVTAADVDDATTSDDADYDTNGYYYEGYCTPNSNLRVTVGQ